MPELKYHHIGRVARPERRRAWLRTGTGTSPRARSGPSAGYPRCLSLFAVMILAVTPGPAAAAESARSADAPKKVIVPFDFVSRFDGGRYGQMLADSIWKKLENLGDFLIPESMQDVRDLCETNRIRITPDTPLETVGRAVRNDFDAQIGIWGSIERAPGTEEETYDLVIRCVDFSGHQPRVIYEKTGVRTNSVSEVPHVYVREMLEKLSGRTIPLPRTERVYATSDAAQERWKTGPNLIAGGDFETALRGVPKGWEPRAGQLREHLGNLVQWLPEAGNPRNHVIHFSFPQVVGDNEGVMYYSNEFPVEDGATYRFQCRWRSDGPAAKVFIKCYDQIPTVYRGEAPPFALEAGDPNTGSRNAPGGRERREVFRSQQNLYGPKNTWNTQTEDFVSKHPRYSPKWGRVMLYAYLGGGSVEFDDVVVKQVVPPASLNLVKDKRHSAASKVTLKEMEENERRGKEARERLQKGKKTLGVKEE